MRHYTPSSGSAKKVYIGRRRWGAPEGAAVSIGSGGEGVQFVDDPALADEVVVVHVGGRPVDRKDAIALSKAALKQQKRQDKGKKDLNVVDQIVAELSAPRPKATRRTQRDGFSWVRWAVLGCIAWIAVVIAAGAPLAILATPVMGPLFGWIAGGMLAIVFGEASRY